MEKWTAFSVFFLSSILVAAFDNSERMSEKCKERIENRFNGSYFVRTVFVASENGL